MKLSNNFAITSTTKNYHFNRTTVLQQLQLSFPVMFKAFGSNVAPSVVSNQSHLKNGQKAMVKLKWKPWVPLWMLVMVMPVTSW